MPSVASYFHLQQAAALMHEGGVVAYPTESVWGLGCDPWQADAVAKLWQIKERDPGKGLIVIAADWQQIQPWVCDLPEASQALLKQSWPGPVTGITDCP